MAIFNQSIKTILECQEEIADTASTSGQAEMLTRALRSLNASIQHFNSRAKWEFMFSEANPVSVVAPFSVTGVSASAGQSSALAPVGHGFKPDDILSANGILVGTRIQATASASFTMNTPWQTSLGTGTVVTTCSAIRDMYDLPSAWKSVYGFKLLGSKNQLVPVRRRTYDRGVSDEFTPSTPQWYDISLIGAKGKIRLLPPPSSADVLQMRLYRRITVPTSASASAELLDVPQDYEVYVLAWAKWHFLLDKGDGKQEQAKQWLELAEAGITHMMSDQTIIPDEDLVMMPGHAAAGFPAPDSTRHLPWDY